MGTSQSINPGVSGDPNWGKTSSSISNIANRVKKENDNPEILENQKYSKKREASLKKTLGNYIKAAGGRDSIISGNSSRGGKAAMATARSLSGILQSASQGSFNDYVEKKGFASIKNKSKLDLIHFLMEHLCGPTSNFDEAAAKAALNEFFEIVLKDAVDAEDVEEAMGGSVNRRGIDFLLVDYFGLYIFEHLFQPIQERLFTSKGEKLCNQTMGEIKDFISSELKVLNSKIKLSNIDWDDIPKRDQIIKNIFNSVIQIFE